MKNPALTIIIPAKNEEASIAEIVSKCKTYSDDVMVIDGNSTDKTRQIAESCGAVVYSGYGRGKGRDMRLAIEKAKGEILLFIDADGSHSPDDIPRIVHPIMTGQADHVTGSRMSGGSDELHGDIGKFVRMIGSAIITLGINYRFNVRLTDSQNGFRAIRRDVASRLGLRENITTIEQEMIIKTLRKGFRIAEAPAHEYERKYGKSCIVMRRVWMRYVLSWFKYLFF